MLTIVYQEQYKQRKYDNQESFNKQLNKNITIKQLFNNGHIKYIKRALIINPEDLEKETVNYKIKKQ